MSQLAAVCLLCLTPAWAAPQTYDFEAQGQGWTSVTPGVAWQEGAAFRGKSCLALAATGEADAWAASEPLQGTQPGQPFTVTLAVKRSSGQGDLALHLSAEAAVPAEPLLWRSGGLGDGRWHMLSLQVVCGLAQPRLLLGCLGGPGAWLVDELSIAPTRLGPVTRPVARSLAPTYCETLPAGWQPAGDLGLRARGAEGYQAYYVEVGPLHLDLPREVTLNRGDRTGVQFEAVSRGDASKVLRIEALAPEGWRTEVREVKITGKVTKSLNIPLQAMLAGDYQLKLRFACDGEKVETPLAVHVQRCYPAFGVEWEAGAAPVLGSPAGFLPQLLALSAQGAAPATLPATGTDLMLSCLGKLSEAQALLGQLPEGLRKRLEGVGLADGGASIGDQAAFAATARAMDPNLVVASPPVTLAATAQGLSGGEPLKAALGAGLAEAADVLAVRLPGLAGAAVLREAVDGKAPTGAMHAWSWFDRTWAALPLRARLREGGAALPLLARGIGGRSTGDQSLDALLVARLILEVLSAGANSVTLPGRADAAGQIACTGPAGETNAPLLSAYGELARELAGVRSLVPPPDTDFAGYLPGKAITYRPFLRGDEGVIALWNNSDRVQEVAVEVRLRPMQVRLLRLSYPGELVQREYTSEFDWDATARFQHQSAIYVALQPLQVVVLTMKLKGAHAQWLREVGPKPAGPPVVDPMSRENFDANLWGHE